MVNVTMQIHLQNVKFFAYHGIHQEEAILGGNFEVNLSATYLPATLSVTDITDTLDYTSIYDIVKSHMNMPTPLLETLATEIASEIIAKFSIVSAVVISIFKLHPPIENFQGSVGVTFTYKRD